ncbi:glucose-6-phosphate dehydrogenase assembly protein OpcA [Coraliomargarita algicola]|uniref:Glucose-6-phosphate dehydrogenase assembly protein OpcA n=1 Tax=Coraliomargarita algicola TaxID=3092156 RepID=A0ABZ0REK1_9BACT|nr:glucose-6-phosphate dehydrogenase assembly protein OpcA [Coraliomargarita sp. J2-16]WPJ93957.1 glucose-6-phosphate dehydrogenase assembly protein OpcA [Coraliomargarita sp. J2-16]
MKDLIDVLPGIDLPVGEVTSRLDRMWESDTAGSPSAFRASQMNVVLHFGWGVSADEAHERFEALLTFAQRYPSRIIVLCPSSEISDGSMRAKLFSQCYIGDSHREMCCCEALILGYQPENCGYLANQVSVWLEPDLPSYHWFCGVPGERIEQYFDNLLLGVRRSIYDSSYEGRDLNQLNWPEGGRVGDLAMARLLPVRQAIGQFLSGYEVSELCRGLEMVRVRHGASMSGEGLRLMEWVRDCLSDCQQYKDCSVREVKYALEACDDSDAECALALEFVYTDGRYLRWRKFCEGTMGEIEASLGKSVEKISTRVKPLGADQALAEALFF